MTTKTAKKTPKKSVLKVAKKKVVAPEMKSVAGEQCFWMNDGRILADMRDLRDAFAEIADEVFAYHVSKEKNDFADWVEQVLEDEALAAGLRKARKPKTAYAVTVRRLKIYGV